MPMNNRDDMLNAFTSMAESFGAAVMRANANIRCSTDGSEPSHSCDPLATINGHISDTFPLLGGYTANQIRQIADELDWLSAFFVTARPNMSHWIIATKLASMSMRQLLAKGVVDWSWKRGKGRIALSSYLQIALGGIWCENRTFCAFPYTLLDSLTNAIKIIDGIFHVDVKDMSYPSDAYIVANSLWDECSELVKISFNHFEFPGITEAPEEDLSLPEYGL